MSDPSIPDPDEPDMTAAEYALGVLDGDERRAAAARLVTDPAFAAEVASWEDRLSPLAAEVLTRVAGLYAIEAEIRGRTAEQRRQARQARSRPIVEALHDWLRVHVERVSGVSELAKAMRYALRHWSGLIAFLDDGRIELDSNSIERAMRPVCLSRKNSLFAGSDEGAENWACMASLVETCKLNGVNPQLYLTDLLTRLING